MKYGMYEFADMRARQLRLASRAALLVIPAKAGIQGCTDAWL
ncbi:hypothetical protein [Lysobacter sp. CA199]